MSWGKEIKCEACQAFYLFSPTRLINSIKHEHSCKMTLRLLLSLISDFENVIILSLCTQHCYGCHNVSRKSTSGLWILMHGVNSLPDATSYDIYVCKKNIIVTPVYLSTHLFSRSDLTF